MKQTSYFQPITRKQLQDLAFQRNRKKHFDFNQLETINQSEAKICISTNQKQAFEILPIRIKRLHLNLSQASIHISTS